MLDDQPDRLGRLRWMQPDRTSPIHELRDRADAVHATLTEDRPARVSVTTRNLRRAVAAAGPDRWEFSLHRHGLSRWIGLTGTIQIVGSDQGRLVVGPFLRRGELLLAATPPILWDRSPDGSGTPSFLNPTGEWLVSFGPRSRTPAPICDVELGPAGTALSYRYLLVALGCYLEILGTGLFR